MAKGPATVLPHPDETTDGIVLLRPWEERDLPLLERAAADEYVALIESLPVPFTPAAGLAWIAARHEGAGREFAVEELATRAAVGGAGVAFRHVPGLAELGYWVVADRRGAGLGTRVVRLASRWAHGPGGVERLQATVAPWNFAAQRVLERAGFAREGLMRGYAAHGGTRRDVYLYARLARDAG